VRRCIASATRTRRRFPPNPCPRRRPRRRRLADLVPAQLQITPVESLLRPGQKQTFKIRIFNANGRYLDSKTVQPTFELKGPGKLEAGMFTTPGENKHVVSLVTAKVGNLDEHGPYPHRPQLSLEL